MVRFPIGDVLLPGTFVITPEAVAAHVQSRSLGAMTERPGTPPRHSAAIPRTCPEPLLVGRAAEAVRACGPLRALDVSVAQLGRMQVLTPAVIGEPITCVATVRFRSIHNDVMHLELRVELRRRRGGVLSRFDLGLDLRARAQPAFDASRVAA
jgi:hypothetical protein